jgi:FixJ family two-component response regulator
LSTVPLISIVDDDESVRAGLSDFITSIGYTAHTFESAEDFLDSAQLDSIWCVIADVCLEAMNGVQLQHYLREQGHRVPFIFITAIPDDNMRKRALDDGAICFLVKPLDGDLLINCLGTAIKRRQA